MYRSLRAYGMGGVVHTTGDYADALFANPARHNQPLEGKFSIIDLTLESTPSTIGSIDDLTNIKGSGSQVVSSVAPLVGKNLHARVSLMIAGFDPEFIHEDWGFAAGILIQPQLNLYPHYDITVDSQTYIDAGPHLGVAKKFMDGRLSVGVNLHYVYRVAADKRFNVLDIIANNQSFSIKTFAGEGIGLDADLGAFYKIPWEWSWVRLSAGLTFNNLLKSSYQLVEPAIVVNSETTPPPRNNRTMSVGLRGDFPDLWIFKNNVFALEFQDLGSITYRSTAYKRIHMGGETQLLKWLLFRAGLNQGYPSAGLGFDFPVFKMDIATWGEELGITPGQRQDRRVGLRLAAEI